MRPVTAAPPANDVKALANVMSKAASNKITAKTEANKTSSSINPSEAKPDVKQSQSTGTNKATTTKPPTMKREQSSIFKQFSKTKPKIAREGTGSSVDTFPAVTTPQSVCASKGHCVESPIYLNHLGSCKCPWRRYVTYSCLVQNSLIDLEPMKDASEDEQEADLLVASTKSDASKRASKTEREERLRKMMDDEGSISRCKCLPRLTPVDEPMENAPEELSEPKEVSKPASATPSQEEPPSEPPTTVPGGRRRGRRKVMKKKMLKDEEGYLGKFFTVPIPLCKNTVFTFILII